MKNSALSSDSLNSALLSKKKNSGLSSDSSNSALLSDSLNSALLSKKKNSGLSSDSSNSALLSDSLNSALLSKKKNSGLSSDSSNSALLSDSLNSALLSKKKNSGLSSDSSNSALSKNSVLPKNRRGKGKSVYTTMFKFTTVNHITDDTSRPLVNFTTLSGSRYLFGKIPEGSQRIITAIGGEVSFPKMQGIFLTGTVFSWADIGGLAGLILTISDATSKGITLVGNSRVLSYIIATWRQFVFRKGTDLKILSCEEEQDEEERSSQQPIVANDEVVITPIQISPRNYQKPESQESKRDEKAISRKLKKLASLMFPRDTSGVNSRDPESYKSDPTQSQLHTNVSLDGIPAVAHAQKSISYSISIVPIRGKFDVKKAQELGVKPGPLFKELTMGNSVLNDKGETIDPSLVVGPDKVYPKILFIDIPSTDYYENTINSTKWFEIDNVGLVYHFIGDEVSFNMKEYKSRFIDKFPQKCHHYISHKSLSNNVIMNQSFATFHLTSKGIMNENFNLINSEDFKKLSGERIDRLHSMQQVVVNENGAQLSNNTSSLKTSNEQLFNDEVKKLDLPTSFEEMKKCKFDLFDESNIGNLKDSVHICTPGTGSALPSVLRNVLSNLLRIPFAKDGKVFYRAVLFDVGENTMGSMLRNFGHNNGQDLKIIFKELCLIYLSHLHADHHLGMVSIVSKWFETNKDENSNLYLIVPWQFITFIKDWYKLEGKYNNFIDLSRLKMFSCEDFTCGTRYGDYSTFSLDEFEAKLDSKNLEPHDFSAKKVLRKSVDREFINQMFEACGLVSIQCVRALHCPWSYSSTFKFKQSENETFTVSFSGDTRPNPLFATIGKGSDLLIHEASLDTQWLDEAIAKKHSTMIEAVAVCKMMDCPKLILTHFSTRYGYSNNCVEKKYLQSTAQITERMLREAKVPNIFSNGDYSFENIDICYAYDLMNIRYRDLHKQEQKWPLMASLFQLKSKKRKAEEK
ncbi:hypothetical protein KGF56_004700 [Candida oxycetoniae]|uniref:ribonuclease Z n=1 Tax=Candida oxycetoniae TaxID=497107 RepID=A0AAI9STY9_9ASCO|nr:uncharacterized protein KGF56_004700 [Candida oxycetoniae]KAI3402608.2 hypothetical protein KGF56_004700 [Candida oxycetoniae]